MLVRRALVLAALGLSMLSSAACGDLRRTDRAGSGVPSPVAAAMPTKDQLGKDYIAASIAYNDVWRQNRPILDGGPTLPKGRAAGSDMATANWTLIDKLRAMRASVEEPAGGYPSDEAFYSDLETTLGQAIDRSLRLQELWTRLRDATTAAEFRTAWEDTFYDDDGSAQRRVRSLLGLPDVPVS